MTDNDNETKEIGLKLWETLSTSVDNEVGRFVDLKEIIDFGTHNLYKDEQVRLAFEWCLKQAYLTKAPYPDGGYGAMLIKAYQ